MITQWIAGAIIAFLTGACGWSAGRARGATDALGLAINERDYLRGRIARVEGDTLPPPPPEPPAERASKPTALLDQARNAVVQVVKGRSSS